jgi:hypothetical protein
MGGLLSCEYLTAANMAELLTFSEINILETVCVSLAADCKRARALKFGTWSLTLSPLIGSEVEMVADLSRGFAWNKSNHSAWYKTLRYRALAPQRLLFYTSIDPRLTEAQRLAVEAATKSWSTCRQRDREWYRWYVMDVVLWAPRRLSVGAISALELAMSPPFADITTPHWRMLRHNGIQRVDFVATGERVLGATFARGCLWLTKACDINLLTLLYSLIVRPVITTLNHCRHCPFCCGPLLVECSCAHAYACWFAAARGEGGSYVGAVAEYTRGSGDQHVAAARGEIGADSRHGVSGGAVYGEKPP